MIELMLETLTLADGTALASTCTPMVSRHPVVDPLTPSLPSPPDRESGEEAGSRTKPVGKSGTYDGSSPLKTMCAASTSMVAYTTTLPPVG